MANFKTCINGHNYDATKHKVCPFCPGKDANTDYEKTLMDFKKTQALDEVANNQFAKTIINEETIDPQKTPTPGGPQHPFKRTSIVMDESKGSPPLAQSEKRKLVGWLVTFTHDEYGQDFKLYVGKNKIGSGMNCDILLNDLSVSADHATILFRNNEFLIKDNFSTNGTIINGVISDEGKLIDGDELKVGNTIFKVKTVF
jgi:hypothetical protein